MSGGFKDSAQKAAGTIIGLLALGAVGLFSYIFLNSVAKPYWVAGKDFVCGTSSLHTYYIVNPGPWKTRMPIVEFLPQAGAEVVDFSPGVTVKTFENKLCVQPDGGLPPGCAYFLTYKHSYTNTEPRPEVTCDGKTCKTAPSCDMDLILKILIFGDVLLLIGCFIFAVLYIESRHRLVAEKENSLRDAVAVLLASKQAESIVATSKKSLANVTRDMSKLVGAVKPKAIRPPTGTNGKKGNGSVSKNGKSHSDNNRIS